MIGDESRVNVHFCKVFVKYERNEAEIHQRDIHNTSDKQLLPYCIRRRESKRSLMYKFYIEGIVSIRNYDYYFYAIQSNLNNMLS